MFELKILVDIDAHEDTTQYQYSTMVEDSVYRIHVADYVNTTQLMHMVYPATVKPQYRCLSVTSHISCIVAWQNV